jgi:hypothetical protein
MRNFKIGLTAALAVTASFVARPASAEIDNLYVIGNSLTNDANNFGDGVAELIGLMPGAGTPDFGRHIKSASGLGSIVATPDTVSISSPAPYGTYENALGNYAWDALTLQPYNETLSSATGAIATLIDLARTGPGGIDGTDVFIYTGWPQADSYAGGSASFATSGNFAAKWARDYAGSPSTSGTRDFFERLMGDLDADPAYADLDFRLIPAGDVLAEVDRRARAGEIPGLASAADLYRDRDHMGGPGMYLAGITTLATITGESPVGLGVPATHYGTIIANDDALRLALQQAAWDVVRNDPLAAIPEPTLIATAPMALLVLGRRRRNRPAA